MIMNSGWNNLAWCSEHVSYHKYQLKYFYKSQQDTCTWKHSSLFTMLYYCAWFQIFEFVDHKFSWIRFFCLRLLSTNSRISVYHVTNVLNLINPGKSMPTNENETPVSGSRSTDRICSVSAAPPPPSAAVVLPGVLWSIHGALISETDMCSDKECYWREDHL